MRSIGRYLLSGTLSLCLSALVATPLAAGAQTTAPNEWTWQGGSNTCCQAGVYGTQGTPASANVPSSRYSPATATDAQGNTWLFGGKGSEGVSFNDLWEFNPSTQQWAWAYGSNTGTSPGNWGAIGVAASTNIPSPRYSAAAWVDSSGNFWLFGGDGLDSNGNSGRQNDLWKFDPSTRLWTWMAGSDALTCDLNTVYYKTICGQPATSFSPGGRDGAVNWTDTQGNLWLFGGNSYDSFDTPGIFNDFWMYNTSTNQWTFEGGVSQITCINYGGGNCIGSEPPQPQYGTLGVPASGNNPGGRANAAGWIDSTGNLWIFGGVNRVYTGPLSYSEVFFTDVWKYDSSSSEWTWMAGANGSIDAATAPGIVPAVYGTLGVPAAANNPGSRISESTWIDKSGNFWLFGGATLNGTAFLNDIWAFNPNTLNWAWMGGDTSPGTVASDGYSGQPAEYGTLGVPAPANSPGGRQYAAAWTDTAGNLWLFGGGNPYMDVPYNDLWEYQPSANTLPPAIAPLFSPAAGTYTAAQSVTISNGMANAAIYYTTDGTTPTSASTLYTAPVAVPATETLKAIALASGYPDSGLASALYTINLPVAAPTFSYPAGSYTTPISVALSDATAGAAIYYTTDGTTPTATSTLYTTPIAVSSTETISAIAIVATSVSPLATATYTLVPPPSFSIAGTAVTVAPGATTGNTSTITITPSGGFTGVINLSCAIAPVAANDPASCGLPATATVSGPAAQTTTLTVTTTPAASALNQGGGGLLWSSAGGSVLACLLFACVPGPRRRPRRALGLLAVLLCVVGGAVGCGSGGSGGGAPPNPGTSPGTYTITVTGTSGAITQTAKVTLTIQ